MRRRFLTWLMLGALTLGTLSACGGEGGEEGEDVPPAMQNENGGEGGEADD